MILGIGSDLLDIRRIEKLMVRHERRFIEKNFTPAEIEYAEKRRPGGTHIATYAKRFAAKEACAKALGTGIAQNVRMQDIGVISAPNGAPALELTGGAMARLQALLPEGYAPVIHLTLTDEPPMAFAQVLIEGRPVGNTLKTLDYPE